METKFAPHTIYHIYNQGNNQERIFFSEENYLFFLWKMRKQLLPYVEFLAYCLMPNHFHWLVLTKQSACEWSKARKPTHKWSENLESPDHLQQNLSHAIAILLRSYARAINKQENRSGSLFRQKTKVKNGWTDIVLTVDDRSFFRPENDYAYQCFCYIHENPVKAGLVKHPEDWKYSSAQDYAGRRNGTLCNKEMAKKILWQLTTE